MTHATEHAPVSTAFLAAVVCVLSVLAPVRADTLDRMIARLDSPTLHEREQARMDLVHSEKVTLDQIEEKLVDGQFSLEQKQRLVNAARDRFLREPRAAMGISMRMDRAGVEISTTTTGFQAAELIKQGDVLVSIDGTPLLNRDHLRSMIIARDPGDVVSVDIRRKDAPATVRIKLGEWRNLQADSTIDPRTLAEAWSIRSGRYAARPTDGFGVVDGGLSRKGWYDAAITAESARTGQRANSRRNGAGTRKRSHPRLDMGGEPRGGTGARGVINQRTDADWTRNERLLFQRMQAYEQSVRLLEARQRLYSERMDLVIEQISVVAAQLDEPDLDPSTKSRLTRRTAELQLERFEMERAIRQLRDQLIALEEGRPNVR